MGVTVGEGVGAGVAGAGVAVDRGGTVANDVAVGITAAGLAAWSGVGVINRPQPVSKTIPINRKTKHFPISVHYTTGLEWTKRCGGRLDR